MLRRKGRATIAASIAALALGSLSAGCTSVASLAARGDTSRALERVETIEELRLVADAFERRARLRVGVQLASREVLLGAMQRLHEESVPALGRVDPAALASRVDTLLARGEVGIALAVMRADGPHGPTLRLESEGLEVQEGAWSGGFFQKITGEDPRRCGPRWVLFQTGPDRITCEEDDSYLRRSPLYSAFALLLRPEELLRGAPRDARLQLASTVAFRTTSPDARLVALKVCVAEQGYHGEGRLEIRYAIPLGGGGPSAVAARFPGGSTPVAEAGGTRTVSLANGHGHLSDPPGRRSTPRACSDAG